MDPELKSNLTAGATWKRGLFMLLFAVILSVAEVVLGVVALLQWLIVLVGGAKNPRLLLFGSELARYIYHVVQYLTFNRDAPPFPFDDWPATTEGDARHHET